MQRRGRGLRVLHMHKAAACVPARARGAVHSSTAARGGRCTAALQRKGGGATQHCSKRPLTSMKGITGGASFSHSGNENANVFSRCGAHVRARVHARQWVARAMVRQWMARVCRVGGEHHVLSAAGACCSPHAGKRWYTRHAPAAAHCSTADRHWPSPASGQQLTAAAAHRRWPPRQQPRPTFTGGVRPSASILSRIFCLLLACLTRLAYVPQLAMNSCAREEQGGGAGVRAWLCFSQASRPPAVA